MPAVFVSYCRPSADIADRIGTMLADMGYSVWRDDQLPAHRAYGEVIEEKLRAAKAVVVLWSAEACRSQWVRAEADFARQAGTLVQASIDGTVPPMPFNQIQCADLSHWNGDREAKGWQTLQASVGDLAPVPTSSGDVRPRPSNTAICVLPFVNMSGDPDQEYFSDGISEDITTDLSKISALSVTARNSAFTYKGKAVDIREIARTLGVSHVLEGSVRNCDGRVRITAQLIDGQTGEHLWAERYDRDMRNIFEVQDEISHAIVDALELKLLPSERLAISRRGTNNVEAYDLYLMARNCWIAGDFSDPRRVARVISLCERAIRIDPHYARAWALIALGQAHVFNGIGANREGDGGAFAAGRALALDPDIAEAYLPRAWRLVADGRFAEANAELATALDLDPDSWEVNKEAARLYYRQRRLGDATRLLERATKLVAADFHGLGMLLACYTAQGDQAKAQGCAVRIIDAVEQVVAQDSTNGVALAMGAVSLATLGRNDEAEQWVKRALRHDPVNLFMRYNLGWGLAAIFKDAPRAIEMLAPVLAEGGPGTVRLAAVDPNLDSLRGEPSFEEMLDAAIARVALHPA